MKHILLACLFISSIFAQDFSTRYDVHVSLFDHVGYADVTLKEDGKNYEIKLVAYTIGVAATLLSNRVETFISKGKIINGRYIPDTFVKIKETTKKTKHLTYSFNHEKKEIKLVEETTKLVTRLRPNLTFKEVQETSKEEKIEDQYMDNDSLSAYLNTKINCNAKQKSYNLVAVGAHNDKNNVLVSYLEGKDRNSAMLKFSTNAENIYNMRVEPFDKGDRIVDVLVAFDNDGYMKEAFMGEVFWVGKITAKRVYHKLTSN
ncbi:MAG: DUF3108 domain-containing protein [Sulfurimonas sp.]|uniref:DUF3108 domain-containing protein n=1 Tax=Sulfurimonas sp. TaxID=2022749 RepID=UPI00260B227E|nr:DUF3108 domain-containing protein [Sulfurimonas sp.]MDD5400764.1 DUF3108 domain-containing protein [Sulfurimonas sp.]